jgi:hypothetical protein
MPLPVRGSIAAGSVSGGALPLDILQEQVEAWIAGRLGGR